MTAQLLLGQSVTCVPSPLTWDGGVQEQDQQAAPRAGQIWRSDAEVAAAGDVVGDVTPDI